MEITPEMQAAIDAAVEAATAGLKSNRDKLIQENRELKTAKSDAETAADNAADEAARKAGDLEAIEKRMNDKHAKALKAVQDELDAARKDRDDAVKASSDKDINDTLRSSMVENNVPKHLHGPLTDFLRKKIEVADGAPVMDGKPLKDSIGNYWKTDEGKEYVTAPTNIGTGSTGVRNATADTWSSKPSTPDEIYRFAKLSTEDPALYANLRQRFGMDEGKV
jgi:hypothetical protein